MTIPNSSKKARPKKPSSSYPLFAHNNGQWAKRIQGRLISFGVWADPDAALQRYHEYMAGIDESEKRGYTLQDAINDYLRFQKSRINDVDPDVSITQRHFDDCYRTFKIIVGHKNEQTGEVQYKTIVDKHTPINDLTPEHFQKIRKRFSIKNNGEPASPSTVGPHIARIKALFNYLVDENKIDRLPVFGKSFVVPGQKSKRLARHKIEKKLFTPAEIKSLIKQANPTLKAMVLLGINAGFGNADCVKLKFADIDLDTGWIDTIRPKTFVHRRAKLWPETVKAIKAYLDVRSIPLKEEHAEYVFITKWNRGLWTYNTGVTHEFVKLKAKVGLNGTQRSFYCLRHCFATHAEETGDIPAKTLIMGHSDNSIAANYRQQISDKRIEAVCNHVRSWLYKRKRKKT